MGIMYRVGVDVGLNSTGLAAIEVDSEGKPIRILNMQSVIHDGGVDPNSNKTGDTRKLISGIARRTRRMRRRRRARLAKLDHFLSELGLPIEEYGDESFEPWVVRAKLADAYIEDEETRKRFLSIAFRHIARHRGWRNPYKSVQSLYDLNVDDLSKQYESLCSSGGCDKEDGLTPAQIAVEYVRANAGNPAPRFRKSTNQKYSNNQTLFPQRLMQEDNAYEVSYICQQQGIDEDTEHSIISKIFDSKSPRGSAKDRVGKDVLTGEPRALKASLAFQRFRIIAALSNISIKVDGVVRPLNISEKQRAFNVLADMDVKDRPTWSDVAQSLGVTRREIRGIGGIQDGEDRVSNRAPVVESYFALRDAEGALKKLVVKVILPWWNEASDQEREHLIELLSNTIDIDSVRDDLDYASAFDLIDSFDDEALAQLDNLKLPSGRAAYSVRACLDMADRILNTSDNLHEARKYLYGVTDNWRPPQEPIGKPVGNPSVDRVLKIVNRYLMNVTNRWGRPVSVNIEHVRDGFSSLKVARMYQRDTEQRAKYRDSIFQEMKREDPKIDRYQDSQIKRWEAVQRQGSKCLYCGSLIDFSSCELDHIVPRKGVGATNTKTNLAAVCANCNRNKSNTLFSRWCHSDYASEHGITLKAALERVDSFLFPAGMYNRRESLNFMRAVKARLQQKTEDEAPDNRSIESVAWMADELHKRIDWYYNSERYLSRDTENLPDRQVEVFVYAGKVTAMARRFSGIEKQIHFAGPHGKTRLDRRHHAVDAAVIALMHHGMAMILNEKNELRMAQFYTNQLNQNEMDWKEYPAGTSKGPRYFEWVDDMHSLLELINNALDADRVKVLRNIRLELGNSRAHEDTIHKLVKVRLGDALDAKQINKASTPALYAALTRLPEYNPKNGLPENSDREITVNGKHYAADDDVLFFATDAAQLMVNGGSVEIGDGFHHARVYKCAKFNKAGKQTGFFYGMIRVFAADLVHAAHEDLLSAELPPQSLSMRYGEKRTVDAILSGHAEFVGHLFIGDEIRLNLGKVNYTGQVKEYEEVLRDSSSPHIYSSWVIDGYYSPSRLRLRPLFLSSEGIDKMPIEQQGVLGKMFKPGWLPAVDVLSSFEPEVLRRNGLGEPRWSSNSGLPVSYRWRE